MVFGKEKKDFMNKKWYVDKLVNKKCIHYNKLGIYCTWRLIAGTGLHKFKKLAIVQWYSKIYKDWQTFWCKFKNSWISHLKFKFFFI